MIKNILLQPYQYVYEMVILAIMLVIKRGVLMYVQS